jgi:hypothetical protein
MVGPTDSELDIAPKFLHDFRSLHADMDDVALCEVLYPGGAVRAGEVDRSLPDAFSKSTSHCEFSID